MKRWALFPDMPALKLPPSFPQSYTGLKSSPHEPARVWLRHAINYHQETYSARHCFICTGRSGVPPKCGKNGLVSWLPGKARSKQRCAIWYTLNFLQLMALSRSGAPSLTVSPLRGQAGLQVFSRVFSSRPYWVGEATKRQTANEFWTRYSPEC